MKQSVFTIKNRSNPKNNRLVEERYKYLFQKDQKQNMSVNTRPTRIATLNTS